MPRCRRAPAFPRLAVLAVLAAAALSTVSATADEPPAEPAPSEAAASSAPPADDPTPPADDPAPSADAPVLPADDPVGVAVEELRSVVGAWSVVTEFLAPDGSVARRVEGEYVFDWVVPDRVLAGRSELPELGQASALLFYLREADREIEMVSVGADGRLWVMTGPAGGATRWSQEYEGPNGEPSRLRFTRSNVTPDRFESVMEYTTDGGRTWTRGNHQVFTKKTADPGEADSRVAWLTRHAAPLRSVDPGDDDFSDLEPLRRALDGVRVVVLGEQSHGDGTTFLAKARLLAFLYREMGFDVLVFESGLYDCDRAWRAVRGGADPATALEDCVFGIWTRSEQVAPTVELFAAAARTERPLELAGYDSQFTGAWADGFADELESYLAVLGVPTAAADPEALPWPRVRELVGKLAGDAYYPWSGREAEAPPEAAEQVAFRARLEAVREAIAERAAAPETDRAAAADASFWRQALASLATFSRSVWETDWTRNPSADPAVFELRDVQMGENLVWLARERYPDRKLVVWAATFHGARNLGELGDGAPAFYDRVRVAGDVARRALGDEYYALGFVAAEGEQGTAFVPEGTPLAPPPEGSFEDLARRAGLDLAFLDLRAPPPGGDWLCEPLTAAPLGYTPMTGRWCRVIDGLVFTRRMERSRRREEGSS